ncbi:MAG: DivIVA domain-containing protein [Rhodococcus sp. (in: high G+C Gram-positive bacteria)]
MLTILLYVVVIAVVAAVLFVLASVVFGRGEEMEPLPAGTTATALPARGISGRDVRALRFSVTLRGYDAREVDWALDRLAAELDSLRLRVREHDHDHDQVGVKPDTGASESEESPT